MTANGMGHFVQPVPPVSRLLAAVLAVLAAGAIVATGFIWWRFGAGVGPFLAGAAIAPTMIALALVARRLPVRWMIALIAVVGIGARLAVAQWTGSALPSTDPLAYVELSNSVLRGDGLNRFGNVAYYPPLYPLLLAAVRLALPAPHHAAMAMEIAATAGTAALTFLLGRRWLSERSALVAAALLFLWPTAIIASAVPVKEALVVLLAMAACHAAVRLAEKPHRASAAAWLGVTGGLLALSQAALAPFPFLLLLATAVGSRMPARPWLKAAAVMALAWSLTLTPWWIRNFMLLGEFVPLTTGGGFAFLGPISFADLTVNWVEPWMSEAEVGRVTREAAFASIAERPLAYLAGVVSGAGRALLVEIGSAQSFLSADPAPRGALIAAMMATSHIWYVLILLGAATQSVRARQHFDQLRLMIFAALIQLLCINPWLQFHERHRYFLTPLLLLLVVCAPQPERPDRKR